MNTPMNTVIHAPAKPAQAAGATPALRVAFAGTPEFAATALDAMLAAGYIVPLVLSQPDRPAGRGLKLMPSPVKALAQSRGIAVVQPRSLKLDGRYPDEAASAQAALLAAQIDVMVVAAYGLILPAWALALPRWGCLNIHGSLLPRWRGAAPIHRAIEAGDALTGITVMQMDEGLDTGAMLLTQDEPILADDTTARLHDRLAALGGQLIVQALAAAQVGTLHATPQPEDGICYAHKIDKAEAAIDWQAPAALIERRVRAFDPFPGATFRCDGEQVKVWQAQLRTGRHSAEAPGTVLAQTPEALEVVGGDGQVLALLQLQRPGGKRQAAAAFHQARPGLVGRCLASA